MNTEACFDPTISPWKTQPEKVKDEPQEKPFDKKIILLAGPTASGKTALSLKLAEQLSGEIVSADSMQMYRYMDIGTAKVSAEIREKIPHHLIDIRHVQQPFNVVDFFYEAKQCIEGILHRHKVPIVVGGTGFYFRALIYGPPKGPPSILPLRQQITEFIEKNGIDLAYQTLVEKDPEYSEKISKNDKQKIIRALEIMTLTGNKVSDLTWDRSKPIDDFEFYPWVIYRPMQSIYERINQRCDSMIAEGFLDEVKLLKQEGLEHNLSAAHAIGYRQALAYLKSKQTEEDYQEFVMQFKRASRKYAKRQITWFKSESIFQWLDLENKSLEEAANMIIKDFKEEKKR